MNLHTGLVFDHNDMPAPINLAIQKSLVDFNVELQPVLGLYKGGCGELAALTRTVQVLNASIDVLLGPACTDDVVSVAKLTTVYRVPLLTGGGNQVESTGQWPLVTRTGYNTMTQWSFFNRICRHFNWTNVAVIYEVDGTVFRSSGASKSVSKNRCRP